MSLIHRVQSSLFRPRASSRDPLDNFWYQPLGGYATTSGIGVSPALAQTLSAIWQASRLIGEGIGALPLKLYRHAGPNRKQIVKDVPLAALLGRSPNQFQTAIDFWDNATQCALLRGLFLAVIQPGAAGFANALLPRHPDLVTPRRLPDGSVVYRVREGGDAGDHTYLADEVFVVRGRTEPDGVTPMSTIRYGAQSMATAISAQAFLGRFFAQGAAPGVAVSSPSALGESGIRNLHASVAAYVGGLKNAFGILPLEDGAKIERIGVSPADAQLVAILQAGVQDVARWLNVPLHMLRDDAGGKGSLSSLEVFSAEFVAYTLRPWAIRIEQAVSRDLLLPSQQDELFVEFDLDALLRGNKADRYNAYRTGIMSGFLSRNEARLEENLDAVDGLDEFWQPMNISNVDGQNGGAGDPQDGPHQQQQRGPGALSFALARVPVRQAYRAVVLARETAQQIVRKERLAIERLAREHAKDGDGWLAGLEAFYADHAAFVSEKLVVSPATARSYCADRGAALGRAGLAALEERDSAAIETLSVMALAGDAIVAAA